MIVSGVSQGVYGRHEHDGVGSRSLEHVGSAKSAEARCVRKDVRKGANEEERRDRPFVWRKYRRCEAGGWVGRTTVRQGVPQECAETAGRRNISEALTAPRSVASWVRARCSRICAPLIVGRLPDAQCGPPGNVEEWSERERPAGNLRSKFAWSEDWRAGDTLPPLYPRVSSEESSPCLVWPREPRWRGTRTTEYHPSSASVCGTLVVSGIYFTNATNRLHMVTSSQSATGKRPRRT